MGLVTSRSSKKPATRATKPGTIKKNSEKTKNVTSGEVIHDSHEGSELIIGLVEAVGTNSNEVITQITNCLRLYKYSVEVVSISRDVMPSLLRIHSLKNPDETKRVNRMMDCGDRIRRLFQDNRVLAIGATSLINLKRKKIEEKHLPNSWPGYAKRTAYIIRTLKRPEEVEFLRRVYGSGFYLIGIYTGEDRRIKLLKDKGVSEDDAKALSRRDADGHTDYGQKASDTYHLADFFVHFGDSTDFLKVQIKRIIRLLFGDPHVTPQFDEFAMFMAFAASLRSADMARQVGAVIARDNEILATGANDCPKKGGGLYWTKYDKEKGDYVIDSPKGRDVERGYDSNTIEKNKIINEITEDLSDRGIDRQTIMECLERSRLKDITEYGRSVHAEMEALLHCARNNVSTKGATLYSTTFPCHNCAKHIVASGIERVVYVEPYPKSKALELHDDSMSSSQGESTNKVVLGPFQGVGARRFFDLFSMRLGMGSLLERKDDNGYKMKWQERNAEPRIRLSPQASIEHERLASGFYDRQIEKLESILSKELRKATAKEITELIDRIEK